IRTDARAARRIDQRGTGALEDVDVAALFRVAADVLRAELDVELDAFGHALVLRERARQDRGVHVHVRLLAARAGAAVRDLDRDLAALVASELGERDAVS